MKKKKHIVIGAVVLVLIAVVAAVLALQMSKQSELSFDAVVQEVAVQPSGEIRLIVERTTEIYGDPRNALAISAQTELYDAGGTAIAIEDFQPGDTVHVTLKDAFTEETPFYYPTVYSVQKTGG